MCFLSVNQATAFFSWALVLRSLCKPRGGGRLEPLRQGSPPYRAPPMRRLRDSYLEDPRVLAALESLAQAQPLVIGACHGGLIPVLIAALCVRAEQQGLARPLIVANDPAALVDDLEELGVVAAALPELERFEEDAEVSDRSGHNRCRPTPWSAACRATSTRWARTPSTT